MALRVVGVVVDAEDERDVGIGGGRRDDDLLRSRVEVELRLVALGEEAGRLEHDVDAERLPRQGCRVALGEHLQLAAADLDHSVGDLYLLAQRAEVRVVRQQVRHRPCVPEGVEGDHLEVAAALEVRAEEVPSDPPESVDSDPQSHASPLSIPRRV